MSNTSDWGQHLNAVLYAYRTKVHSTLKVSPYEYLYGMSPPSSIRQDPIQQLGRALGMERLTQLQDRNIQVEDYNAIMEYPVKPIVRRKFFPPEVFTVVASFNNGTCQLQDKAGRLLKRRVNLASLRKINVRSN
ncbi:hypothetical protein BD408DRAFT_433307 [Parasitella parasitica]|nr:hypothetical protein BD408DRAFT_433307 [Parasitella parasitica]